jgi:hypothetical protein
MNFQKLVSIIALWTVSRGDASFGGALPSCRDVCRSCNSDPACLESCFQSKICTSEQAIIVPPPCAELCQSCRDDDCRNKCALSDVCKVLVNPPTIPQECQDLCRFCPGAECIQNCVTSDECLRKLQ